MTIQELMQRWDFNYVISFEYSSIDELLKKADGNLLLLLSSKCHLSHSSLMYANAKWAEYGYNRWLTNQRFKYVKEWIDNAINIYENGSIVGQYDYLCANHAVAEVYNYLSAYHAISGSTLLYREHHNEFSKMGGKIVYDILGIELYHALTNELDEA